MSFGDLLRGVPVLGPAYSLLAGPSDQEKALQDQMLAMAHAYEQYRQQHAQNRTQAFGSQLSMFAPMQQYLQKMMPDIQPFDTRGALQKFQSVTNNMGPVQAADPALRGK